MTHDDFVLVNSALVNAANLAALTDAELFRLADMVEAEQERRDNMPAVVGAPWPEGDGSYNPNTAVKVERIW